VTTTRPEEDDSETGTTAPTSTAPAIKTINKIEETEHPLSPIPGLLSQTALIEK
jgi:hypothetical protein